MPGLTGRMSTVVKAKISHLLDRAEDPAETLDYSYEKQLEQLQKVKQGIADIVTAKKRLQLQETSIQQQTAKLDEKTEDMKARADAVGELEAAGTFEDLTALGPPQDDIDRQLEQLGRSSAVDDELPETALGHLRELDADAESAVSAGDTDRFHDAYTQLLEYIRAEGKRLAAEDFRPSDLLLPPADSSVAEAARELHALELIPG